MLIPKYDFRFIDITHELYALKHYINSIEQQLPDLIKKEEDKADESLKQNGNDEADWQIIRYELYELIDVSLPKYFWGSTLVTLWAIFESGIYQIATEMKIQKKLQISLNDLKGDVIHRVNKYFNHIINLPIQTRTKSWQNLRMLYTLRNAMAHANGKLENIKSTKEINKIKKWISADIGISEDSGNILFTADFIKKEYTIVFDLLNGLFQKVKNEYPTTEKAWFDK